MKKRKMHTESCKRFTGLNKKSFVTKLQSYNLKGDLKWK
jgi:hypothetical protein